MVFSNRNASKWPWKGCCVGCAARAALLISTAGTAGANSAGLPCWSDPGCPRRAELRPAALPAPLPLHFGVRLQPFWFRSASISPLPHLCPENRRRHSDFFVLNLFPCLPTASLQPSAQAARVCRAGCGRVRSLSRVWLGPAGGGGFGAGLRAHGCERPGRARGSADYTSHGALRQVGGYLLPHWSAAPPLCAGIGRRLRALRVPQRGRGRKCGVRRPRWLRGVGVGAARPAM